MRGERKIGRKILIWALLGGFTGFLYAHALFLDRVGCQPGRDCWGLLYWVMTISGLGLGAEIPTVFIPIGKSIREAFRTVKHLIRSEAS